MATHTNRHTGRNGGRHRKGKGSARSQAAYPTFSVGSASVHGVYAKYVGRVGALAVALGVGAAMATGHGLGVGVAWAQEDGAAGDNPSSANTTDPQTSTSTEPTDGQTTLPTGANDAPTGPADAQPNEPGMRFDSSGGLDNSNNDQGQKTDTTIESAVPPAPPVAPLVEQTPPAPLPVQEPPTETLPSDHGTPTPTNTPSPTVEPPAPDDQESANGQSSVTHMPLFRALNANTIAPQGNQLSSSTGPAIAAMQENAELPTPPAPAPLVPQPAGPIDVVLGLPGVVVNIATTVVNMLLAPFMAPGPFDPAQPPLVLFAVLDWVRREIQRTFSNSSPNGVVDEITTSEDVAKTIPVLANDTDPDGDVITVTELSQPEHGTAVLNANGTITYTPNADFNGTDSFTYTVSDGSSPWHIHGLEGLFSGGGHTSTVQVNITVTSDEENAQPDAMNDSATVLEDSGANAINVRGNDTDADGDTLTVTGVTHGANGTVSITGGGTGLTYTPNANFNGTDAFSYTISDGNGGTDTATVNVTVTPVNDPPIAVADGITVTEDSIANPINVLANDTDVDAGDTKTVQSVTQGTNGVVVNNGSSVAYTPNANFHGTDSFSYTMRDSSGATSSATVTVTVTEVNDPAVLDDETATVAQNSSNNFIDVLSGDSDPDGVLKVSAVSDPAHGTAAVTAGGTGVTYTPDAGHSGPDSFTYTVVDPDGHTATANVNVTVTAGGVNQPPTITATPDAATGVIRYTVVTDDDGEGPVSVTYTTPAHGSLVPDPMTAGVYVYTPNADYAHSLALGGSTTPGQDEITFTATDADNATATVTVRPSITPVNADPTVTLDVSNAGNGVLAVTVTVGDADGDPVTIVFADPQHGSFNVPNGHEITLAAGGTATYVYTPDATRPGTETLSFTGQDDYGGTDTATQTVTVSPPGNQPPTAFSATQAVGDTDVAIVIHVSDPDRDAVTLTPPASVPGGLVLIGSAPDETDGGMNYLYRFTPSEQARNNAYTDPEARTLTLTFTATDGNHPPVDVPVPVTISPLAPEVTDPGAVGEGDVVQILEVYNNPVNGRVYATAVRRIGEGDEATYKISVYDATTNTFIGDGYTITDYNANGRANAALIDDSVVDADGNIYHNAVFGAMGEESAVFVVRPDGTSDVLFTGSSLQLPVALSASPDGEHVYLKVIIRPDVSEMRTDYTVRVQDLTTGQFVDLPSSGEPPTNIGALFALYSDTVATNGGVYVIDPSDGEIKLVEFTDTGSSLTTLDIGDATVTKLSGSADGSHIYALVTTGDGLALEFSVVDVNTGTTVDLPPEYWGGNPLILISDMAVNNDGTQLLLVSDDFIALVDVDNGTVTPVPLDGTSTGQITDVTFSADGAKAYVALLDGTGNIQVVSLDGVGLPAEGQITFDDLQDKVNGGLISVSLNDDNKIRVIDGKFTDNTVHNVDDAVDVLNSLSFVLGANPNFAQANLVVQQDLVRVGSGVEGEVNAHIYRLTQSVRGVPVLGSQVILTTDADGNVTGIFSTYDSALRGSNTALDAELDEESEAIAIARSLVLDMVSLQADEATVAAFLAGLTFQARTVIYDLDYAESPQMAWQVEVFTTPTPEDFDPDAPDPVFTYTDLTIYIAANGERRGESLNFFTPGIGASIAQPDIRIYRSDDYTTLPGAPDPDSTRATTAYNNLVRVYEYYRDVLGRNSYDGIGDGAPIRATLLPADFPNAFQYVIAQQPGLGFGGNYEAAVDVVGHEFTHAVIAYVVQTLPTASRVGLAYYGEPGALNESFADILGSLIEHNEGEDRWLVGEDAGSVHRDLSNPTAYSQPDHYDDYVDLPVTVDAGGVHINSGIFNYAAYQMMTDERTVTVSTEEWAQLFYGALYRVQPNAKFIDGRAAVISSAKAMGFTAEQQQAIVDAFDAVGIVDDHTMVIEV